MLEDQIVLVLPPHIIGLAAWNDITVIATHIVFQFVSSLPNCPVFWLQELKNRTSLFPDSFLICGFIQSLSNDGGALTCRASASLAMF
jgi:hypothetical protein